MASIGAMTEQETQERRGDELAARVRAARAWADLSRKAMAAALEISERQVTRLESGEAEVDYELRAAVASVCDVPLWFMEQGFAAPAEPEEPGIGERVEALEAQMQTVLRLTATRAGAVRQSEEDAPQVPHLIPPKARRPPRPGSTPSPHTEQPAQTETDEQAPAGAPRRGRETSKPKR